MYGIVANDSPKPDTLNQLILADYLTLSLGKIYEHLH
jgi:hypothetical protein